MTNADWIGLLQSIPETEHPKLVLVLQTGSELCVDTLVQFEPNYLVMRGRVGGNVEDARGFFVPYAHILCVRLERSIKLNELAEIAGHRPQTASHVSETVAVTRSKTPTPLAPADPAAASRLLVERLRAARVPNPTTGPASSNTAK